MKSRIKILITAILLVSLLTACVQTSVPDDLSGKIDRSRTVEYVVIKEEQKDDILYIFSGKEKESPKEVEDEKPEDKKDELKEEKPEKPVENEKPPAESTQPQTPESEVREIETPVTPPADNSADDTNNQNDDTNDYQIGDEPGAAVIPDEDGE